METIRLPGATTVGRVRFQGSDLGRAEAFSSALLGLDVTQRGHPGVLFLSAGGYHPCLGLNTWAGVGAAASPPDAAGLQQVRHRLEASGLEIEDRQDGEYAQCLLLPDPNGHGVSPLVQKSMKPLEV